MMPDKDEVREKLKECYDPEIPINIVDLGLIYDLDVQEDHVDVTMTLTAVGCPVADQMKAQVEAKATEVEEIETSECEIVFEPPWTEDMVNEDGQQALQAMGIM